MESHWGPNVLFAGSATSPVQGEGITGIATSPEGGKGIIIGSNPKAQHRDMRQRDGMPLTDDAFCPELMLGNLHRQKLQTRLHVSVSNGHSRHACKWLGE